MLCIIIIYKFETKTNKINSRNETNPLTRHPTYPRLALYSLKKAYSRRIGLDVRLVVSYHCRYRFVVGSARTCKRVSILIRRDDIIIYRCFIFIFWLVTITDARDTDLLGKPGRSGREFARRSALETHRRRWQFHFGPSPDGTSKKTARLPSLSGLRHAYRQWRVTRSDHRADH